MDISSLRERNGSLQMSVTELNAHIKRLIDSDRTLSAVSVRGEISNFTYHRTGHLYFTLKDEDSQVRAVMFRSSAAHLKFVPENGMKVIVRCSVSVYCQAGNYQLYVTSIQPDGIGALYLAYEQLKAKLESEGLFAEENKKLLPRFPQKIGVITSPTGAAVRDIINVTGRRCPSATIYLYPSLVQGDGAEENLIRALDYFESSSLVDVIIIGRGGGSIEDLWAFNSERLARKIFECKTPIISAVGHETDFTICDFVADLRAPTPSAAAEIAVPDMREVTLRISSFYDRCEAALFRRIERAGEKLSRAKDSVIFRDTDKLFSQKSDMLEDLSLRLTSILTSSIDEKQNKIALICGKLNALSPLATLARGYSVTFVNNKLVNSTDTVNLNDTVIIRVSDGEITADIKDKRKF